MKLLATVVMSAALALAAGSAVAQDKKDAMAKAPAMTMKDCQDYTAMAMKDAAKKDAKKEAACADMMKKADAAKKDAPKK